MGKAQKIAALNDAFRRQPRQKGKVVMTAAIDAMGYPFIPHSDTPKPGHWSWPPRT